MHANDWTPDGVLNHTVSGSSWWRLRFDGVEVGEIGINAALCGTWGCPVVLVTGDDAVCREAQALLGEGLTTVAVKKGLGRLRRATTPSVSRPRHDEEGARVALADVSAVEPYNPGLPCEIGAATNSRTPRPAFTTSRASGRRRRLPSSARKASKCSGGCLPSRCIAIGCKQKS